MTGKRAKRRRDGRQGQRAKAQGRTPGLSPDMLRDVAHVIHAGGKNYFITDTVLRNMVRRDALPIQRSFDEHFGDALAAIDEVFSEAAALCFMSTNGSVDSGMDPEYAPLVGLTFNALHTVGAAVMLLRSGMKAQSMVLIRQAVEMCATIIHIVGDDSKTALRDFKTGTYKSTNSIGEAKKAVPIIGAFWGFLSSSYVHINKLHSIVPRMGPFEVDDDAVRAILPSLRVAVWLCYLAIEIAYPATRHPNKYWKLTTIDGRNAVSYEPSDEQRRLDTKFLDLPNVDEDDLRAEADIDDASPSTL